MATIYSPSFLLADMRAKFSALADETIAIKGVVLTQPIKPDLSATSTCVDGKLAVNLKWEDDKNSESFSLKRNDSTLISDLTKAHYTDSNVKVNTTYSYVVTALGSMGTGMAVSDTLKITTPAECVVVIPFQLRISEIFISKAIGYANTNDPHETTLTQPVFSGSVNLPQASLRFAVDGFTNIFGETTANANGYWQWQPPTELPTGAHIFTIIAQDPENPTQKASAVLHFTIRDLAGNQTTPTNQPMQTNPAEAPLDFAVTVKTNPILQGKSLEVSLQIKVLAESYANVPMALSYKLFDQNNQVVLIISDKRAIASGETIAKTISLPNYVKTGVHKLTVEIFNSDANVTRDLKINIQPVPILSLGGGFMMTYPEILSNLGTISLTLLMLLFLWLIALSREYWLYLHALRNITEENLEGIGLFTPQERATALAKNSDRK